MAQVLITDESVSVDGVNIASAVKSYTLHRDARTALNGVSATLEVVLAAEFFRFGGDATVGIPKRVHEALVALGWTPPPSP